MRHYMLSVDSSSDFQQFSAVVCAMLPRRCPPVLAVVDPLGGRGGCKITPVRFWVQRILLSCLTVQTFFSLLCRSSTRFLIDLRV